MFALSISIRNSFVNWAYASGGLHPTEFSYESHYWAALCSAELCFTLICYTASSPPSPPPPLPSCLPHFLLASPATLFQHTVHCTEQHILPPPPLPPRLPCSLPRCLPPSLSAFPLPSVPSHLPHCHTTSLAPSLPPSFLPSFPTSPAAFLPPLAPWEVEEGNEEQQKQGNVRGVHTCICITTV